MKRRGVGSFGPALFFAICGLAALCGRARAGEGPEADVESVVEVVRGAVKSLSLSERAIRPGRPEASVAWAE